MDTPSPRPGATIYEVAEAAGVSPSTVSRTFSRPGRVSIRTADKVRQIAEKLGYHQEEIPRPSSSPTDRTGTIGLAIADATNPFFFGILRGAEQVAAKAGYTVVLIDAQESDATERKNLSRALPNLDALLLASTRMSDPVIRGIAKTHPVVVLNRQIGGIPSVLPDTAGGVEQAVGHLLDLGHTHIHYLAGPDLSWMSGMRWMALRNSRKIFSFTEHRIASTVPTLEGGSAVTREVLAAKPTAVLCYNDLLAMGLIRGLTAQGVRVPEDISVIGFDNIFASDMITPALTTVAAPLGTLGEAAMRHLIAALQGTSAASGAATSTVPSKLIIRQSTGQRSRHIATRRLSFNPHHVIRPAAVSRAGRL